jgi:hypothetical protein
MKFKAALLGLFLIPGGAVTAQEPSEWEWTLAPYLWATNAGLDLSVNDQEVVGAEADFSDLVDKVDTVLLGYLEARKGRWGAFIDTVFFDLSDNKSVPVGAGGPIPGDLYADARITLPGPGMTEVPIQMGPAETDLMLDGRTRMNQPGTAAVTLSGPMLGLMFKF